MWTHIQFIFWLILKIWLGFSWFHSISKPMVQYYSLTLCQGFSPTIIFIRVPLTVTKSKSLNRSIWLQECIHEFYNVLIVSLPPPPIWVLTEFIYCFTLIPIREAKQSVYQVSFKIHSWADFYFLPSLPSFFFFNGRKRMKRE